MVWDVERMDEYRMPRRVLMEGDRGQAGWMV